MGNLLYKLKHQKTIHVTLKHSGPAISYHLIKPGTSKHGTWA